MDKPTVTSKALLNMANRYEQYAQESRAAWILVGNYDTHSKYMDIAYTLRRAAAEKSIWERRDIVVAYRLT